MPAQPAPATLRAFSGCLLRWLETTASAAALLTAFGGLANARETPPDAARPNVLFVGVDDLRCAIGALGDPIACTPHLDRLLARGTVFTRAYVQQAVCAASRASLLTGYRPDTTTVDYPYNRYFIDTFLPAHPSLPRRFFDAGYHTVALGKLHHGGAFDLARLSPRVRATPPSDQEDPWWQSYATPENRTLAEQNQTDPAVLPPAWERADVPDEAYSDGRMTRDAIATLRAMAVSGRPFFLAAGYLRPHLPFAAPERYWALYDEALFATNPPRPSDQVPDLARASYELPSYAGRLTALGAPVPSEEARRLRHGYYASVSYVDALIGRLVAELDTLGVADRTIIVLWSDHGFHLGENGSWGKHTNYELATRAPLLIVAPGKPPGQVSSRLVEYIDIVPTVCALAGLPAPEDMEGRSLVPLLDDPETPWIEAAFSQFDRPGQREGYALRTERHRYVEWRDKRRGTVLARELYDHATDPAELNNLATKETELVAALAHRLSKQFPFSPSAPANTP